MRQWLYPVQNESLLSAQLMKRKQKIEGIVDTYAQNFESLFERSYGRQTEMDISSKELLKRDLFVEGLLLKWQEKVISLANSYLDSLHQARAAEEQQKQLREIHDITSYSKKTDLEPCRK